MGSDAGALAGVLGAGTEAEMLQILPMRHSIFSLRRFRALAAQEILDFPRCAHAWAPMQVLDSSRRGMACALGVC